MASIQWATSGPVPLRQASIRIANWVVQSQSAASGQPAVNARDRIGSGPWYNAKGARIAQSVADLHGDTLEQARRGNNLQKPTALNEKGEPINGVGDTPNRHDMLTGSQLDGTAFYLDTEAS